MVNKRCCLISFGSLFLLIGAALIVIIGGVLKPVVNNAIEKGVKDGLYIDYSNYNEKDRTDFLLSMKNYDYYFFNVTNVAQIRSNLQAFFLPSNPVKANVKQLGPYLYRYYEYKTNVVISTAPTGEELITYNIWWFKNPIVGNTASTDKVCTVNPIYMGALNQAWQQSFYAANSLAPGAGLDEFTLERQLFALFVPQISTQVVPLVVGGLTTNFVANAGAFLAYYMGYTTSYLSVALGGRANVLAAWRTNNVTNALNLTALGSNFTNFEIGVPTDYHPGPAVTAHLFNPLASDYSFINATGFANFITLMGQLAAGNTAGAANFGAAFGGDLVADGQNPATETSVLLAALGGWIKALTGAVTVSSTIYTNGYTYLSFQGIGNSGVPGSAEALTWTSWSDLSYAQLGNALASKLLSQPAYLSLIGLFTLLGVPQLAGPIVTPLSASTPLLSPGSPVPSYGIYGTAGSYNITYRGLELSNAGFTLTGGQARTFFGALASQGTTFYGGLYGAGLNSGPLSVITETPLLTALNGMGFNFNTSDAPASRRLSFILHDYLASTASTFILPNLVGGNSGLFTCQTADAFINKGYVDYTTFAFPGYFTDNNVNYTGSLRTYFTGKNNADIARFLYARENRTTITKITDTGASASSYCPKNLATSQYVCQDLWSSSYGVTSGLTVTIKGASDFNFFGPFQEGEDPRKLQAYSSDLLRVVNLSYVGDQAVKGVSARLYSLADEMLANRNVNPVNANYRMSKTGIAPMKFAAPLWGFTLSRPHFYGADSTVTSGVNGLNTSFQEAYETHLWMEPLTGAAIKGTKKLQGSFRLSPFSFDERGTQRFFTSLASDVYFPTFWADENAVLNDSQADDLSKIFDIRDKIAMASPIGYGVGAGVFFIGLVFVVYGCKLNSGGSTQLKSSTTL